MEKTHFDKVWEYMLDHIKHEPAIITIRPFMWMNYCRIQFPNSYAQDLVRISVTSTDGSVLFFYFKTVRQAELFINTYKVNHSRKFWVKVQTVGYPAYNLPVLIYVLYGERVRSDFSVE